MSNGMLRHASFAAYMVSTSIAWMLLRYASRIHQQGKAL
jgi:hypothetical protein